MWYVIHGGLMFQQQITALLTELHLSDELAGEFKAFIDEVGVQAPTVLEGADDSSSGFQRLVALQEQFYAFSYQHRLPQGHADRIWRCIKLNLMESEPPDVPSVHDSMDTTDWSESPYHKSGPRGEVSLGSVPRRLGRYEDIALLGIGGMGEVRRVLDPHLNCSLAIKIIHRRLLGTDLLEDRFRQEAQIVSQLQHPNIPPIHDLGTLPDGRLYFTMREIKGRSLSKVIREVHEASAGGEWNMSASGWNFRRTVDVYRQVCEAVAYAHTKGVIHRDLKPANIMVGSFGEVLVVDWGLAKVRDEPEAVLPEMEPVVVNHGSDDPVITRLGSVQGTPTYMSPEQARGQVNLLDERSDVYSLGVVLYEILSGRRPYAGKDASEILSKVRAGPPPSIRTILLDSLDDVSLAQEEAVILTSELPLPMELVEACERAMRREPEDRFQSAGRLAQVVKDWLDGARKRARALQVVKAAQATESEEARLRRDASVYRDEAGDLLSGVLPYMSEESKSAGWSKEDAANELERRAALKEDQREQLLQGALTHRPDLPEAHAALALHYRELHIRAEMHGDEDGVRKAEARLRTHAVALHEGHPCKAELFAYLKGDGVLQLFTQPEGAEVFLEKYVVRNRRLIPEPLHSLGSTPLVAMPLAMGSYLLRLRKEGFSEVVYPVCIDRLGNWSSLHPGKGFAVNLPKEKSLSDGDLYVPAGWFWSGGDPHSASSLPRRQLWLDGFVIQRFPVTNHQYIEFLDDLAAQGRLEDAMRAVPRTGSSGDRGAVIYGYENSRFFLCPDDEGDVWDPDYPVCYVDWFAAEEYAKWLSARTGQAWRLPFELEWEKASRGVDGRFFPWGNHFDASWCCVRESHEGRSLPAVVDSFPVDCSPYGMRGASGNMSEWTASPWREEGAPVHEGVVNDEIGRDRSADIFYTVRGGGWNFLSRNARLSDRIRGTRGSRTANLGFRLVRPVG
jgi:eukaryotic-like serine/threonine-protein kinase